MEALAAPEATKEEAPKAGEILFCGGTSWETLGRKVVDGVSGSLPSPTRLVQLHGVNICLVAAGSASCHCIALDVDGRCFTWGRNEKGQLGHGDFLLRASPTIVTALARYKVVKAAGGRQHTVVITDDHNSFSFGFNKHGQLGAGFVKDEGEKLPVRALVTDARHTACGADFTVWLTSPGGVIQTAGLPQYGQLGHGTDNEYNSKEGSVRLVYEAQPRPRAISSLAGKNITKVACGNNHSVAVDSDGCVYTWGFGGHGRLGHKEQKDEWVPRVVDTFQRSNVLPATSVVAAGSAYSACTAGGGQLYMWGRVKTTGDSWMYPKPVLDLSGWTIRSLDCGNTSSVAAAEESCISWGTAVYGELGYGPTGPKSSANPKKIDALEGLHIISVACGVAHSLFVVDRTKAGEKLEQFESYDGAQATQVTVEDEDGDEEEALSEKEGKKRKVAVAAGKRRGRPAKKKAASESDEEYSGDDDSDEPSKPSKGGRGRGRGRVRGSSKATTTKNGNASEDEAPAKRGRGRPRRQPAVESQETSAPVRGRGRPRGRGRGK